MVSAGDTDISLHICPWPISNLAGAAAEGGGLFWGSQNLKPFSAKICLNLNFHVCVCVVGMGDEGWGWG